MSRQNRTSEQRVSDIRDLHSFVKEWQASGTTLEQIASTVGVGLSALKQFLYDLGDNPYESKTYNLLKNYVDAKFGFSYINNINVFGDYIEERIMDKVIGNNFILYRFSLFEGRLVKIEINLRKIGRQIIFEQNISGISTRRKVLGRVGRYGSNIYMKGVAFAVPSISNKSEMLADSNIIGEEIISFLESDLNANYMICNFFSFSGVGNSICGNGLLIRRDFLIEKCDIGNYEYNRIEDVFMEKNIPQFIDSLRDELNTRIYTISYKDIAPRDIAVTRATGASGT